MPSIYLEINNKIIFEKATVTTVIIKARSGSISFLKRIQTTNPISPYPTSANNPITEPKNIPFIRAETPITPAVTLKLYLIVITAIGIGHKIITSTLKNGRYKFTNVNIKRYRIAFMLSFIVWLNIVLFTPLYIKTRDYLLFKGRF